MAKLSMPQMMQVAYNAGFRGQDLAVAGAVARAESGGDPNANAVNSKEDSRGLWQINTKAHTQYLNQNLYDPQVNANAAMALWSRSGWGPWSAHNNKSYLLFMPEALSVLPTITVVGKTGEVTDQVVSGAKDAITEGLKGPLAVVDWLKQPNTWVRIAKVGLGLSLAIVGALVLVSGSVLGGTTGAVKAVVKGVK